MRLVAPSSLGHAPVTVRPSPAVRPVSSTVPTVRLLSAAGTPAAATAAGISAVSMPATPTLMKRKREDDDDYDVT